MKNSISPTVYKDIFFTSYSDYHYGKREGFLLGHNEFTEDETIIPYGSKYRNNIYDSAISHRKMPKLKWNNFTNAGFNNQKFIRKDLYDDLLSIYSLPIIAGRLLCFGSNDFNLYFFDSLTGKKISE